MFDRRAGRVKINRGSDDGLSLHQELCVYRRGRSPRSVKPECLGRIRIVSIELDSAMAELIASEGKMINEGDCASTRMARLEVDQ